VSGIAGLPDGFYDAAALPRKDRLVLCIDGMEKCGKSHLALSAEGPIAYINMDNGLDGVLHKFTGQKPISVVDISSDPKLCKTEWDRVEKIYYNLLANPNVRTVVWDTTSAAWGLVRMAKYGKLSQVPPQKYVEVNTIFRDLLDDAIRSDKNIILVERLKKAYVGKDWRGNWERAGFGEIGYHVQMCVRCIKYTDPNGGGSSFGCTITDSRHNPALEGQTVWHDACDFEMLKAMAMAV